jgi:hypothetical protein
MHPRWHAAAKLGLGSFIIVLVFGAVGVAGAVLGQWAGAPRAASTPEPAAEAAGEAGETSAADPAAAANDDIPAEAGYETALQDGLELPGATAAEVLVARFPAASQQSFSLAMVMPGRPETSDPSASDMLSGMVTIEPLRPDAGDTPAAAPTAPPAGMGEPDATRADPVPPRHVGVNSSARSPYVLNDAMIASIKRRLRLTADQEKLWFPVEAALRKLVYTRAALNPQHGQGPVPYIDPASSGDLKTAAMPLIMRLNEGQRREVRDIVHVMGLTAVASQL